MQYHLLPDDDNWQLREEGSSDPVFTAKTKAEALDKLESYMDSREGSVVVQKGDGQIQEHRNFDGTALSEPAEAPTMTRWGVIGAAALMAITVAVLAMYLGS